MIKRLLLALILFLSFSSIVFFFSSCARIQKAAEQGDAGAQNKLAGMYYMGEGMPQNYVEAMKWYKKAAEQGNARAQASLAGMYYEGEGEPQNYTEALKWYKKAAEQGHVNAQYNLAGMYYRGEGVPQNHIEGYVWYSVASAKGDKDAKYSLSAVESEMTSDQIAEAQKEAAVLWEKINKKN